MESLVSNLQLSSNSVILLVIFWVISHIFVLFSLIRTLRVPIFVVIGTLIIAIYWLKPYSYDLEKYSTYYETGYLEAFGSKGESHYGIQMYGGDLTGDPFTAYESGFDLTAKTIRRMFPEGQLVRRIELPEITYKKIGFNMDPLMAFIIVASLIMLFYSYRNLSFPKGRTTGVGKTIPIFLAVALGSIFFFMGSQNTIRQLIAICIATIGFSIAVRTRKHYLLAIAFVSLFYHFWTVIYCGFLIVTYLLLTVMVDNSYRLGRLEVTKAEILALVGSSLAAILLKILIVTDVVHSVPWLDVAKYYLLQEDVLSRPERFVSILKISALIGVFLISESLAGKATLVDGVNIRNIRRVMFFLLLPFMLYPELLSRLIYYYLCAELFFLLWTLTNSNMRLRLAGAVVYLSYGFAPNAVSILSR